MSSTTEEIGRTITIATPDGPARGWWHGEPSADVALIAAGGVGNDATGPSHIYPALATRLRHDLVATVRVEYRHPGHLDACVADVLGAVDAVTREGARRVALLGWSFGGAVMIGAGAASRAVAGVATIASQTFGAEAVSRLAPRALLLIHGTADEILPPALSQRLYASARDPRRLVLYDGDDHAISRHRSDLIDVLARWAVEVLAAPNPGGGSGRPHVA